MTTVTRHKKAVRVLRKFFDLPVEDRWFHAWGCAPHLQLRVKEEGDRTLDPKDWTGFALLDLRDLIPPKKTND